MSNKRDLSSGYASSATLPPGTARPSMQQLLAAHSPSPSPSPVSVNLPRSRPSSASSATHSEPGTPLESPLSATEPGHFFPGHHHHSANQLHTLATHHSNNNAAAAPLQSTHIQDAVQVNDVLFSRRLEHELLQPLPLLSPLSFDPLSFIQSTFPDTSVDKAGQLHGYVTQLHTTIQKLFENKYIREDKTAEHTHVLRCIEESSETYKGLLESVRAMCDSIESDQAEKAAVRQTPPRKESTAELQSDRELLTAVKRHMIMTLRALRNLHVLIDAVDSLLDLVEAGDYSNVRRDMEAILEIFSTLQQYEKQPIMQQLRECVNKHLLQLKKDLFAELRLILPHITDDLNFQRLHDSFTLIEELFGEPSIPGRTDLISWFAQMRLKPFHEMIRRRNARRNTKGGTVENLALEPLFKWMQEEMEQFNSQYVNVFPAHWCVPQVLLYYFTKELTKHVHETLRTVNDRQIDLLRPLQAVKEYEKWVIQQYGKEINERELCAAGLIELEPTTKQPQQRPIVSSNSTPSLSVYAVQNNAGAAPSTPNGNAKPKDAGNGAAPPAAAGTPSGPPNKRNSLSITVNPSAVNAFNQTSAPVSAGPSVKSEPMPPASAGVSSSPVLTSAASPATPQPPVTVTVTAPDNNTNGIAMPVGKGFEVHSALSACFDPYLMVFVEIESEKIDDVISHMEDPDQWSVMQGNSKSKPRFVGCDKMLLLAQKSIKLYSQLFQNECFNALVSEFKRGLIEYLRTVERRLPSLEEFTDQQINYVVVSMDTADYINERMASLSAAITKIIDETYKDYIDFSSVQSVVSEVLNRCMQLIKQYILHKLEPAFRAMAKTQWDSGNAVVDEHPFMKQMLSILRRELTGLAHIVSDAHLHAWMWLPVSASLAHDASVLSVCHRLFCVCRLPSLTSVPHSSALLSLTFGHTCKNVARSQRQLHSSCCWMSHK